MEKKLLPNTKAKHQTYGPDLFGILKEICTIFDTEIYDVLYSGKKEVYVRCKRIYYYVATKVTDANLSVIGKELRTDHATVLYHLKYIRKMMKDRNKWFAMDWAKYSSESKIWKEYGNRIAA